MSRRIEIEITSVNGEVATWRAAGAKLPKGVLNVALVPGQPVVGGVYRADVEQYMEGMDVLAVLAPKTASPLDPRNERLQLLTTQKKDSEVTVSYASKGRGPRRDDDHDGERREGSKRPTGRPGPKSKSSSERGPRPDRGERADRPPRAEGAARPDRGGRPDRSSRPDRSARPTTPPMTTTFRNALLATLSPEQLPVAEQLLRGGMPSVRVAVAEQNKNATAQGRTTVDPETIDRIAEELLGKTTLALWKDRAAGGIGAGREFRLRDLRAVVTSAKTVSMDDEAREQLKELKASLTTRIEALRVQWTEKLDNAVNGGNVAEALRLVASPPDMSTRVSAEMATKVATMASEALTATLEPVKWVEIVNLVVDTSMRRNVKPIGIPADDACKNLAVKSAGAIPELAKLLGMKVPPPPPPTRSTRPVRPNRRPATRPAS